MKENIYIFGDSNVRFLSKSLLEEKTSFWEHRPEEMDTNDQGNTYWTGHENHLINDLSIDCFWQTRFPTKRLNLLYIKNRLENKNIVFDKLEGSSFVFQLGRVDLQLRDYSISELEDSVIKYIASCHKISKFFGANLYITTPIIHRNISDVKLSNHFDNLLHTYGQSLDVYDLIDFTEFVGRDFKSVHWDPDYHTNKDDSRLLMENIIKHARG
jgi:hypothetical protein